MLQPAFWIIKKVDDLDLNSVFSYKISLKCVKQNQFMRNSKLISW